MEHLQAIFSANTLEANYRPIWSLVAGVGAHIASQSFEIDHHIWYVLLLFAAAFTGVFLYDVGTSYPNVSTPLYLGISTGPAFLLGLSLSICVYRAYTHRLYRFPGPFLARISRLWMTSRIFKDRQMHRELERLHNKYGDFVRIGPRHISITRPSAVQAIYGPQSPCRRSMWYAQVSNDPSKVSLQMTRIHEYHRQRRKAWDQGLSVKALASYEPQLISKCKLIVDQIQSLAMQRRHVNISQWGSFFTFDIAGLLGFGKDFQQIENAEEHPAVRELHQSMGVIGLLSPTPWAFGLLESIPGGPAKRNVAFKTTCAELVEEARKKWEQDPNDPTNIFGWVIKAFSDGGRAAPPIVDALHEDGRLMLVAGSDTCSGALAHAIYYLTKNPSTYKKLQHELDALYPGKESPGISEYGKLRDLPYLDAIIYETLRLKPAAPSGQFRDTPPDGLQIDEVRIPGNTIVVVPQHVVHRDERSFPDRQEFYPERWLDNKRRKEMESVYFPFQTGPYNCVGKQLAMMMLRLFIANIVLHFDVAFPPGENGDYFENGAKDTVTFTVLPLDLEFKPRGILSTEK